MEMRDEPEMLDIDAVYTDASDTFDEDWLGLENNVFGDAKYRKRCLGLKRYLEEW
jgi:hypothetical protein